MGWGQQEDRGGMQNIDPVCVCRAVVPKRFTVPYPFRHSISSYVSPSIICATSDPNLLRLLLASHQQNRRLKEHYLQAIGEMSEFILQVCVSNVEQGGMAGAEFSTDVTFSQWFYFLINA